MVDEARNYIEAAGDEIAMVAATMEVQSDEIPESPSREDHWMLFNALEDSLLALPDFK